MNTTQNIQAKVSLILSGSCNPASDLLELVNAGLISENEATQALYTSGRKNGRVRDQARQECAYMAQYDI